MYDYVAYARILGIVSLVISLGLLFHLGHAKKMAQQMAHNATGYIMGGVLPAIVGSIIITQHNVWLVGWAVTVTLFGWVLISVAVFRLWFVHAWEHLMENYIDKLAVLFAIFGLMFSLFLLYAGFLSHHTGYSYHSL